MSELLTYRTLQGDRDKLLSAGFGQRETLAKAKPAIYDDSTLAGNRCIDSDFYRLSVHLQNFESNAQIREQNRLVWLSRKYQHDPNPGF
jgi:hypothetical protein